jgi:hypothetical protein
VAKLIDLTRTHPTVGPLPDFLIVGHPKCGTTALFELLRTHPEIHMPARKEPWFFAEELHVNSAPRPEGMPRTVAQYAEWFDGAQEGQKVGEASPHYLWSSTAAANIAELLPDARIIAILREPANFLFSLHLQWLELYYEVERDMRRALELEDARRAGEVPRYSYFPQLLMYSEFINYTDQLRRYHAAFPAEQVKVLIYEDFRADNEATVRDVRRYLGVREDEPIAAVQANPTVAPRSQRLNELVHAVGVGRGPVSHAIKGAIKAVTPAGPRRRALYAVQRNVVFGPPPEPDEELLHELRLRYRGQVEAASEYLDRDLVSLWGYDRL